MASRILIVFGLLVLIAALFLASKKEQIKIQTEMTPEAVQTGSNFNQQRIYFYPIKNYRQRITERGFGKEVKPTDNKKFACGASFSGFHTADDLEVTNEELQKPVPVFAVASGRIEQAENASGYGGLIIIRQTINNQEYTAIYGHIDLKSLSKKTGDRVEAGEKIAELGDGCSAETDNERKHLHFGLVKGNETEIRGYVKSSSELERFQNPSQLLEEVGAVEPN